MWFLIEIAPIGLVLIGLVLLCIMFPAGLVHNLIKPFYDSKGGPFSIRIRKFGMWWVNVVYQTWRVIRFFLMQIAVSIDIYGNVIAGELIEDLVTAEEDTLFGKGDITISTALGKLQKDNKLNNTGIWLVKVLDRLDRDHEHHCLYAYELYEFKQDKKNAGSVG